MWNVDSTTALLKTMSALSDPDDMLRLFIEHVHHRVRVDHALVLNNTGLTAPQYRIIRCVTWDANRGSALAESAEVRSGGLLATLLYSGQIQKIDSLAPEASDPALDLLRGSRSLIAFPLFAKALPTGMVVMLGPSPHTCSTTELCGLAMMSAFLDRTIHGQTLIRQLESSCRALDSELRAAADVQRWLLPPATPVLAHTSIAASYQTAQLSGGDYYDYDEMPDGRLGVLIADVSGKGAAAAVLMVVLRTIVREASWSKLTGPASLLDHADHRLCLLGLPKRGVFVTALSFALDPATGILTYSSAGHNPPRLLRASQRIVEPMASEGATALGMLDEPCTHTENTVVLGHGDLALFYTDGITEARSPAGEFFGEERLDEVLRTLPVPATPASAVDAISRAVRSFTGAGPLLDDQTLLAVGRHV